MNPAKPHQVPRDVEADSMNLWSDESSNYGEEEEEGHRATVLKMHTLLSTWDATDKNKNYWARVKTLDEYVATHFDSFRSFQNFTLPGHTVSVANECLHIIDSYSTEYVPSQIARTNKYFRWAIHSADFEQGKELYELGRVAKKALGLLAYENEELWELYNTAYMKFSHDGNKQLEAKVKMHESDNQRLMHVAINESNNQHPALKMHESDNQRFMHESDNRTDLAKHTFQLVDGNKQLEAKVKMHLSDNALAMRQTDNQRAIAMRESDNQNNDAALKIRVRESDNQRAIAESDNQNNDAALKIRVRESDNQRAMRESDNQVYDTALKMGVSDSALKIHASNNQVAMHKMDTDLAKHISSNQLEAIKVIEARKARSGKEIDDSSAVCGSLLKDTMEESMGTGKMEDAQANDIITINAGGKIITAMRSTLTIPIYSMWAYMFSGRWEESLTRDSEGRIFMDYNPELIEIIVDYLREKNIEDPSDPLTYPYVPPHKKQSFERMLCYFGLTEFFHPSSIG